MSDTKVQNISLAYINRFNIENKEEGLREPSGLALSHGKRALWTVSDDTKKIFKLSLEGDLKKADSFEISDKGLEGIALHPNGEFLIAVKEDGNEVLKVHIDREKVIDRHRLAHMAGFDSIAHFFAGSHTNKGLEGVTWDIETGTVLVMKEGNPGLLVELSSDLKTVLSHQVLGEEIGFWDPEVGADDLDFSDLCYDGSRDRFWIISDKAKRLFCYDRRDNTVVQSIRLGFGRDGEYQEIKKAEGVAIDPEANRLYVVSDQEVRLYVFDIRE